MKNWYVLVFVTAFLVSCQKDVPQSFSSMDGSVDIYPDYEGVTIPYNIAPLNFEIVPDAEEYLTKISSEDGISKVISGKVVKYDISFWKKLLSENKDRDIAIDVFLKEDGKWNKYQSKKLHVSSSPIDEYLTYRLIQPSYELYRVVSIHQRNLTSFEERELYNSFKTTSGGDKGECINCHSYQNYHTDNMMMHVRGYKGGTLILNEGELKKVNLNTKELNMGAVYPSWHPHKKMIAFSVNSIGQYFHTQVNNKVEVIDTKSDIILYDVDKNEISLVVNDSSSMETFPYWSPDGEYLYYVSSKYNPDAQNAELDVRENYRHIKYDILRIKYDQETGKFGKIDSVYQASKLGKSATFPRVSPDGKYLLFTLGNFGQFHIWHKSADLCLMDLQSGNVRYLNEVNSKDVESYHSWSSNGRWIILSSRREDGSYTRPYISYFDASGKAGKPFVLPQKDPAYYKLFLKSFNIPEFTVEPVKQNLHEFFQVVSEDPQTATFKPQL